MSVRAEAERLVHAEGQAVSQRALALRTGSDIASARAAIEECNESSFGKAAVVSATTNAGVGRVFRMMVVNNDAQEAVHSSPDASAHMFALLPPGCDDTHVVAQALADEAAFASDTLMSQSNSFLHCLSTCGSCMNSVTPVQHERKPNPPVAKNTTDEQLFEQKPQQEQQDAQPSTAHAHPHTMSNDPAHENTNATEKADNHRQKQLHASAKPMASNKQVKTDANKSSDAKDKMMSMFNKAHKKDASVAQAKGKADKKSNDIGSKQKYDDGSQSRQHEQGHQKDNLALQNGAKPQRLQDSDDSEDEYDNVDIAMEREEPEDDQAAVEAEEKNGIGEQQKQLDEELRQQEMQEREDKHTGAMYDFAQAGNTVQNRGKRKVTRTFINDEGEEVTHTVWEDDVDTNNENAIEQDADAGVLQQQANDNKRKEPPQPQQQQQKKKAAKAATGAQARINSFLKKE